MELAVHEDSGEDDGGISGAVEVVDVAGLEASVTVDGSDSPLLSRSQSLEDIGLTGTGPWLACHGSVLGGTRVLSVEEPDGRHVLSRSSRVLRPVGHGELEDEGLLHATETVVSDSVRAVVAAVATVGATDFVRPDGKLLNASNRSVGKDSVVLSGVAAISRCV